MAADKDAKIKAKRENIKARLGAGGLVGKNEPVIDVDNYTSSLMVALNYYNTAHDNKEKRKWFLAYTGKKASDLEHIGDYQFRSVGTIIRLKQRDQYLDQKELDFIETEIKRLSSIQKPKVEVEEEVKPKVTIQDRMAELANSHIAEFNGMMDDFISKDIEPNFSAYLKANQVSPQVTKLIPSAFDGLFNELNEVLEGEDKQLVEGWSNLKKPKIKKILKLIEDLKAACAQRAVSAKARKPRARKEKPAYILAAKVKYMKEFTELGLTSDKPEKIVGASEVMIYNTKYKKLQIYRAADGGTLSIKGTTITNYDVANSSSKTLRKPEQMKDYITMAKKTFASAFKALKTKDAAVNGRINEDCIIAKVF